MQVVDSNILAVSSSPLGLLTVVESPRVPFRYAPGLSLNTRFEPAEQLAVFTDGDSMSAITRFDGNLDALGYLGDVTAALPYALQAAPRVLILGADSRVQGDPLHWGVPSDTSRVPITFVFGTVKRGSR